MVYPHSTLGPKECLFLHPVFLRIAHPSSRFKGTTPPFIKVQGTLQLSIQDPGKIPSIHPASMEYLLSPYRAQGIPIPPSTVPGISPHSTHCATNSPTLLQDQETPFPSIQGPGNTSSSIPEDPELQGMGLGRLKLSCTPVIKLKQQRF